MEKLPHDSLIDKVIAQYASYDEPSYLPLLLFALAHKDLLYIRKDDEEVQGEVLLTIPNHYILKNTYAPTIKKEACKEVKLCYNLPEEGAGEWKEIIDFLENKWREGLKNRPYDLSCFGSCFQHSDFECRSRARLIKIAADFIYLCQEKAKYNFDFKFFDIARLGYEGLQNPDEKWTKISTNESIELMLFMKARMENRIKSTVYNPLAGPAVLSQFLNDTHYIGNTHNETFYHIGKLYQLCRSKAGTFVWNRFGMDFPDDQLYDYILFCPSLDGFQQRNTDYRIVEAKLANSYLDQLSTHGQMVCTLYDPDNNRKTTLNFVKRIVDNDWLASVICFQSKCFILEIDKAKRTPQEVVQTYLDYKPSLMWDFKDWRMKNKDKVEQQVVTNEDIRNENYFLSPVPGFSRAELMKKKRQYKVVRLSSLLKELPSIPYKPYTEAPSLNLYLSGEKSWTHYPFLPYLTAQNGVAATPTKGMYVVQKDSILIPHQNKNSHFNPFLFNADDGRASFTGVAYEVNTEVIDPEFLILEMNKDYFQREIKESQLQAKGINRADFNTRFLQLCLLMPENDTSMERQHQVVEQAHLEYVSNTGRALGVDLTVFTKTKDSYLTAGTRLRNNEYTILGTLGHGGFGRTYRAESRREGVPREVAIKEFFIDSYQQRIVETNEVISLPNKDFKKIERARVKFNEEAYIIKELSDCRHIIKVYDVFNENGTSYYVMELMKNGDLINYRNEMRNRGEMTAHEAIRMVRQVALALKEMHRMKMNHLDVKPNNILIDNERNACLIDFGTIKEFDENTPKTTIGEVTSGIFSAPEVHQRKLKTFSPQADIYSLGKTLEYLLQGETAPQEMSGFIEELPGTPLSPAMTELIEKCTAYDPEDRPKNIDEFLTLLEECNS